MTTVDQIAEHLMASGLRFKQRGDKRIDIGFNGENTLYEAVISVRGTLVSVVAPNVAVVPFGRLEEAIRLANLLNTTRLSFGNFWVHPTRQRVAFGVALAAPDGVTRGQVRMAMAALSAIDDFFPAFARVLWGGMQADHALDEPTLEPRDEEPPLELVV